MAPSRWLLLGALGAAASLSSGGCGPKSPPKLPVTQPAPLRIPMPPRPPDAELYGYVQLRDAARLLDLVGPAILSWAQEHQLSLGELKSPAPISAFLWDPSSAQGPDSLPVVAALPLSPESQLLLGLRELGPPLHISPMGSGVLVSANPDVVAAGATRPVLAEKLHRTPPPFDAFLYLHAEPILKRHGATLRRLIGERLPEAAASPQRPDAPSAQSVSGTFGNLMTSLDTVQALGGGLSIVEGGVELSLISEDKPLLGAAAGGPVAAPDLAALLPPGDVRLQWNARELRRLFDNYLRIYAPLLDERPGLRQQIMPTLDEWLRAVPSADVAYALTLGGGERMRMQLLLRTEQPAEVLGLFRRTARLAGQGVLHDGLLALGIEVKVTVKEQIRKLRGWPIDSYTYEARLTQPAAPEEARELVTLLNGLSFEVGRVGPYLVGTLGGGLDELVERVFKGPGSLPLRASRMFPPGGTLYADLDVGRFVTNLKRLVPPEQAARLPALPPQLEPVSVFAYDGGRLGYYKLHLPITLITAVATAGRRAP